VVPSCMPHPGLKTHYMAAHWYLKPDQAPREYDPSQPVVVAVTNFITAFILYSEPRLLGLNDAGWPAETCCCSVTFTWETSARHTGSWIATDAVALPRPRS
jgi:hypothetical protein